MGDLAILWIAILIQVVFIVALIFFAYQIIKTAIWMWRKL